MKNDEKPDGYCAYWNGRFQNGLAALDLEALELIVHERLEDAAAFDCMNECKGWEILPVKLIEAERWQKIVEWVGKMEEELAAHQYVFGLDPLWTNLRELITPEEDEK